MGTIQKIRTDVNVLYAAIHRIEWLFETFSSVCLSFSGGKDSTVLLHLTADVARRKKRRFSVLFIDWEAQYQCTIAHILKMREMPACLSVPNRRQSFQTSAQPHRRNG